MLLLISSYTEMVRDPRIVAELEWFPVLARAAANTAASRNNRSSYLPLCPSKGDVAAHLYYIRLNGDLFSTFNNVNVGGNSVADIVQRLIRLSE